jgi:hypothetical protein
MFSLLKDAEKKGAEFGHLLTGISRKISISRFFEKISKGLGRDFARLILTVSPAADGSSEP